VSARLIVLLGALTAFSPLAIDMYLPAFPRIQRDLAAPPGTLQLTLSLFLGGLSFGQFVVGPISDRTGRRPPLMVGCVAFAGAALLCTLAPSVGWLMAARFVMGFAGAAGLVISRAVVHDQSPSWRAGAASAGGSVSLIELIECIRQSERWTNTLSEGHR
jgi:DHA1 family bicyclomycin/chloramphenicol resistance-like MFS transporter